MPVRLYEGVDLNRIKDRDIRAALKLLDDHARSVGPAVDAAAASAGSGGGGGAPTSASYVTVSNEASLTGERALAVQAPITKSDGGANGSLTLGATFGTPAVVLGTAAAAGVTDELLRRDCTILAFDVTNPADTGTPATGSAGVAARRDHVHRINVTSGAGVTGTLGISNGGTGQTTATAAFDALAPSTTNGDLLLFTAAGFTDRLAVGSDGQILMSDSSLLSDVGWKNPDFFDNIFRLSDNIDDTKKLSFQLSGLTTGTTRIWTVPDGNITPVNFSGQIGGTAINPDIRGIRESGGPTLLTIGAIVDGEFLVRSGATIVSSASGGGGDSISVNGTAATDADFDDSTPAAPTDGDGLFDALNVRWQKDTGTPNNVSAYLGKHANGQWMIGFSDVGASAVNYIGVRNALAGALPAVAAVGTDTNISLALFAKGTGTVFIGDGSVGTPLQFIEQAAPTTPAANNARVYAKDKSAVSALYALDDGGTEHELTNRAPKNVDYLVGTASSELTGEIVAGTSPGGQLGGSWASPDVRGLRETFGPTLLTYGAIIDGSFLTRSGGNVIGSTNPRPNWTLFEQDLGAARRSGTFDLVTSSATTDKVVCVMQTAKAIASRGNARDESEMDQIQATGYVVDATTIRVYWWSPNVVVGTYAFAYFVSN